MANFTTEYVQNALKIVKNGKAAHTNGDLPEFLKNLGPRNFKWIAILFSNIVNTYSISR